jgi:hypothetical protein
MGHFKRITRRVGVLDELWNVGEVVGVSFFTGAETMVSLDGGCGSAGSLVWVAVEMVLEGAVSSFILALVLVGGMYSDDALRVQGGFD